MLYEHFVLKHLDVQRDKPVVPFAASRAVSANNSAVTTTIPLPDDCFAVLQSVTGRAVGGGAALAIRSTITALKTGLMSNPIILVGTEVTAGLNTMTISIPFPILVPGGTSLTFAADFSQVVVNTVNIDVFAYLIPTLKI